MIPVISWEFDPATGTFRCPALADDLWTRAMLRGRELIFGGVNLVRGVKDVSDRNSPACRLLIRIARGLHKFDLDIVPELRLAMSTNFGRRSQIAWYDPSFEGLFLSERDQVPTPYWACDFFTGAESPDEDTRTEVAKEVR